MSLLHQIASSQTAAQKAVSVIKEHRGVLHNLFVFTFRIALCGVHLFLNGFLKSAEKLIDEKYNYKDWITNQLYTPFNIEKWMSGTRF